MTEVLIDERRGRVALLTLNRPEKLNALSPELHDRLLEAVSRAANDPAVGCVVLTGAGRAFCSGGDITGARLAPPDGVRPTVESRADGLIHHGETARLLHSMPKPTIAMVNGVAAGAGLALALACDLRVAAHTASFTTSYVRVGLSGDFGASWSLTRLVGPAKARELMFLSDRIEADEALRLGLVNRLDLRTAWQTPRWPWPPVWPMARAWRYVTSSRTYYLPRPPRSKPPLSGKHIIWPAAAAPRTRRKPVWPSVRSVRRSSKIANALRLAADP
jgi:enoyl-CoA hydratase/carnithine racemase